MRGFVCISRSDLRPKGQAGLALLPAQRLAFSFWLPSGQFSPFFLLFFWFSLSLCLEGTRIRKLRGVKVAPVSPFPSRRGFDASVVRLPDSVASAARSRVVQKRSGARVSHAISVSRIRLVLYSYT